MIYTHDYAVLIGRFQPFHYGHAALLQFALESAPMVNIVLGSAFSARSAKNPFTWEERAEFISATLDVSTRDRIIFTPVADYYNDARWTAAVIAAVNMPPEARIALIGHNKDSSSYYLRDFPAWDFISIPKYNDLNAATVRKIWFEGATPDANCPRLILLLPQAVLDYLPIWPYFAQLRAEYFAILASQTTWGLGPFITVDTVIRVSNHVLIIQRGHHPGCGLLALPGGFLDRTESLLQGAVRELREETNISLPDKIIVQALVKVAVFDHPERSQRGRTITHVHFFDFPNMILPNICGADDAAAAEWIPLAEDSRSGKSIFRGSFPNSRFFL